MQLNRYLVRTGRAAPQMTRTSAVNAAGALAEQPPRPAPAGEGRKAAAAWIGRNIAPVVAVAFAIGEIAFDLHARLSTSGHGDLVLGVPSRQARHRDRR